MKSHRLQLALTCMGTVLGQEALEAAFTTSEIISDLGVVEAPVKPETVAGAPHLFQLPKGRTSGSRRYMASQNVLTSVPQLLTVDFYTQPDTFEFDFSSSIDEEFVFIPEPSPLFLGTLGLKFIERRKRG